jgi:hypothetical protein
MTWLLKLLEQMSPSIVSGFHEGMTKLLQGLYDKAFYRVLPDGTEKGTKNKWDDLGIKMMAMVFGVELTEPKDAE